MDNNNTQGSEDSADSEDSPEASTSKTSCAGDFSDIQEATVTGKAREEAIRPIHSVLEEIKACAFNFDRRHRIMHKNQLRNSDYMSGEPKGLYLYLLSIYFLVYST